MSNSKGFTEADVPQQTGKSFIVTGANAGVGFEIARVLAARGARVYAELVGYGGGHDGNSLFTPDPRGSGLAHAIAASQIGLLSWFSIL